MVKQTVIGISRKRGYAECWRLTPSQILEYMNVFNYRYDRWEIVPDHTWYKATWWEFDKDKTININGRCMTILEVKILPNDPYVERRFFGKKKGL